MSKFQIPISKPLRLGICLGFRIWDFSSLLASVASLMAFLRVYTVFEYALKAQRLVLEQEFLCVSVPLWLTS